MTNSIHNYELLIIDHERKQECFDKTSDEEFREILKNTCQGAFDDVLRCSLARRLLSTDQEVPETSDLLSLLSSNVESYFRSRDSSTELQDQMSVLCIALSCLQLFVQNNWVGPLTDTDPLTFLPRKFQGDDELPSVNAYILSCLSVDGESVYKLSRQPVYLLLARILLLDCRQYLQHCQTHSWWLLRCLWIQQAILEERSPTLKATIQELIAETLSKETLVAEEANNNTMLQFHLEAGYILYYYYEPTDSKDQFAQARKRASITCELTGIMGKRTKFQQKDLAQLLLKVERNSATSGGEDVNQTEVIPVALTSKDLPKDLALDDDTILNAIELTNEDQRVVVDVSQTEQALILAMCHEHRRSHEGVGDILREESLAFVNCVLSQRRNWNVLSSALMQRSYWESDSSRRVERAMGQLEELVGQLERPCARPAERLHLLYASKLPPKWEIQRELGHIFVSLGLTSAALDTYLALEMWEDVIKCYKSQGRREKAEEVIRNQLAEKETPSLWCYLGDVTEDRQYYQRAWDLSGCRYARAMRCLGLLHLREGEFQNCIECLEKSLKINPLQIGVWFSFGCACMAVGRHEEAARAFRRCVIIHSDNFEAWNNLATAYIRCGQKAKAFVTFGEALKCDYENWRLWENYMLTGTDVGQFEEVIRAYHRLMDIREKHTDSQVLGILVRAVNEDIADFKGHPGSKYRDALLELFGRVTAKITTDADVWRLYAKLLSGGKEEPSATTRQRAVQYLQKSHRCMIQDTNWFKDPAKCKKILDCTTLLAKAYLEVCEKCSDPTQAVQMLSSAKLSLKGVLTKVKQVHTDAVSKQLPEDLVQPCNDLEAVLETVLSTIELKKGT